MCHGVKGLDEGVEAFFGLIGGSDRLVEVGLGGCVHGGGVDKWRDYCRITPVEGKEGGGRGEEEGGGGGCGVGEGVDVEEGEGGKGKRKPGKKGWLYLSDTL